MIKTPETRRAGISLAEVLICIFVLALGLLGILSLFPLGAVRMVQAIKDDRTKAHELNSTALSQLWWNEEYPDGTEREMYAPTPNPANRPRNPADPLLNAMENPNFPWNPDLPPGSGDVIYTSTAYPAAAVPREDADWSYPVLVDPVGWNNPFNLGSQQQFWVGGNSVGGPRTDSIPRRSLRRTEWARLINPGAANDGYYIVNKNDEFLPYMFDFKRSLRNRYFVLLEDMGFGRDGTPLDATGTLTSGTAGGAGTAGNALNLSAMKDQVQRDGRYTCAWLLRRQHNRDRTTMQVSVVVFSGRSADGPAEETIYTTRFVKDSTEATVFYPGLPTPKIRKGTWLLDGTLTRPAPPGGVVRDLYDAHPDPLRRQLQEHGVFYRVVSVTEDVEGGNPVLRVELQEPARATTHYFDAGLTPYGLGVVMEGVSEVFQDKKLAPSTRAAP